MKQAERINELEIRVSEMEENISDLRYLNGQLFSNIDVLTECLKKLTTIVEEECKLSENGKS